jgi:protein-S-isoprenylcysteine O-methyltransferase Ste14
MAKLIAFGVLSVWLGYISRKSLRVPGSHGFYRFFAWEIILALFLLNVNAWFREPLSWHQLIAWALLLLSLLPLVLGFRALAGQGRPTGERESEPLLGFERTTVLVTRGVYGRIRHPLYCSLLLLAWGIFFKLPTWYGVLLALGATGFLLATARADEAECRRFFGPEYEAYARRTARFVPFLF